MHRKAHRCGLPYLLAEVDEADNGLVKVITHSSTSPARKTGPRPSLANTSIMAWTVLLHNLPKKTPNSRHGGRAGCCNRGGTTAAGYTHTGRSGGDLALDTAYRHVRGSGTALALHTHTGEAGKDLAVDTALSHVCGSETARGLAHTRTSTTIHIQTPAVPRSRGWVRIDPGG